MSRQPATEHLWRELCERQEGSGLSISAFCARHRIGVSTFYAWRRRLAWASAPAFVELTSSPEPAPSPPPIELVLPAGVTVRVQAGFDASTLRQVVEALS